MILATLLLAFGGVTVELPERVDCAGVSLRLGDIAKVTGDDAEQVAKVEALDLGYMPSPGYSRLLQKEQLRVSLTQALPGTEVTFLGSQQARVFPKVTTVTAQQIETAAKGVVEGKFLGLDVDFELRGELKDLTVPMGRKQVEVKARQATGPRGQGSQGVAVDILVDGELWRTQWTSWAVNAWEEVAILNAPVARGEKLSPALFRVERRRQPINAAARPLAPPQAIEAQATRDLAAGEPVYPSDVERTRIIQRNNVVQVTVLSGRISAVTTGQAQEDGRMGDQVRVRMTNTGKELVGTVSGVNRMEIRLR